MENLIETLRFKISSYGHFKITIKVNDKELSTITTNACAIDAAFDDCYDDQNNSGRFYESRLEAQKALVNEILIDN